jgi:nicotinamide-nucleotide amidase
MKSCVITIGDEILIGQVSNTNADYLCRKLFSLGMPAGRVVSVPDEEDEILKEFGLAYNKFNVIIVTGGLGPTHDDITKTCIVNFFNTRLVLDRNVLGDVEGIFKRRKMRMSASNMGQAMVPEIAVPLRNDRGTAPGLMIVKNNKVFCAMPGVPFEMKRICETYLFPFLDKKYRRSPGRKMLIQKTLHTIGISESLLYDTIGDVNKIIGRQNRSHVSLAFLPSNFETRLRLIVEAPLKADAEEEMKTAVKKLKARAGRYIYSYDESTIQETIGKLLKKQDLTLAVAESCTGGQVASKITDVPGSSDYFLNGLVTYSNEAKMNLLGVKKSTLKNYGAVSEQTAVEMARGVRVRSEADVGLSTTGIAGPSGATKEKPVGLIWIGYSDRKVSFAKEFIFTKDRLRNKEVMSKMTLEILRRKLLGMDIQG